MKHELQHPDSPTWCISCGRFDHNCEPDEDCPGVDGTFDSRNPEVFRRMYQSMFPTDTVLEDYERNFDVGGEG